ncbi:MAG: L-threonylcarbamoyladenylate synthase [Candidatus Promineifilaceae bacterium]|nr:L-threonylcarbamoyladenylate synthase [Candidatus Promineifilaceae bacterium]
MKTVYLHADEPGAIARAAMLLGEAQLVVFPTDTLYGVGADPFNPVAIERLYEAKGRSLDKGIPILLADLHDLDKVVRAKPAPTQGLIERFWPGPLTLILPRRSGLPANISPNENIAVRIPESEVARAVIRAAGGAVATSSANRSGEPGARSAGEALSALGGIVAAIVDGGPVEHGAASTIVDCTVTPPRILRPGPLTAEDLGLS